MWIIGWRPNVFGCQWLNWESGHVICLWKVLIELYVWKLKAIKNFGCEWLKITIVADRKKVSIIKQLIIENLWSPNSVSHPIGDWKLLVIFCMVIERRFNHRRVYNDSNYSLFGHHELDSSTQYGLWPKLT